MVEPREELWTSSGKVYKSIPELVDLLRSRGLVIDVDDATVEQFLTGVNYYRFTGYALPFLQDRETYRSGSVFSDVCAVYAFDRKLRNLFAEALSVIELTFRTNFARELAKMLGAEAYLVRDAFRSDEYDRAMGMVRADYEQSVERCAQHFKHQGTYPPIWALVEVTTFGHLSRLFKALRNEYRSPIAKLYGYDSSKAVCSLLQHLCVLRNRCAHHSRMYDLPWGQNDEPKDIDIGSEEERRRRRLYIFSELPEWTKLKQVGVEIPYFRPLFFQLALVYRFLKATPRAVYDCQEWRKRVSEFLQNVPQVQARGVNFRALLHVPNDPITSKIWRFDD